MHGRRTKVITMSSSSETADASIDQAGGSTISESTPFLEHRQLVYSIIGEEELEPEMIEDLQSKYDEYYRKEQGKLIKRRFWWFCCLGFAAIVIMHLCFLPRTSLSRDFRRWYNLHLTKSDTKSNFLLLSNPERTKDGTSNKNTMNMWLGNFSAISEKHGHSLISTDNPKLEQYVIDSIRLLGYHPKVHSYTVPQLRYPQASSLSLISPGGDTVYDASLKERGFTTPAFLSFGSSGDVTAPFAIVGEGTHQDYSNDIKGKIVITKSNVTSVLSTAEKVQIAQQHGAVGFITYWDDPSDESAISRDSGSLVPSWSDVHNRPAIPAIPVSFASIKPIIEAQRMSQEQFKLHLTTIFTDDKPRRLSNIISSINGILKDGDIIIGAARDSLTSTNVLSNHVVLFEIMKHYRELIKLGWKPLRTIHFVSWDGSRSGLIGSQLHGSDTRLMESKRPILCYFNLDVDLIRGTNFKIESSPVFDHLLKKTARFIPFPFGEKDSSTLSQYWKLQDENYISNLVSDNPDRSDAFVFQNHLGSPVVNARFDTKSNYFPNSNKFSLKHVEQIDSDLILHSLLARYVGLFAISLSEREILHSKTEPYFESIANAFDQFSTHYSEQLSSWKHELVPSKLLEKSSIYDTLKNDVDIHSVKFGALMLELKSLFESTVAVASHFDTYSKEVQEGLIEDYPWYKLLVKLKRYAQYKIVNHKLVHLENELSFKPKYREYIYGTNKDDVWFQHLLHGEVPFSKSQMSEHFSTHSRQVLLWRLYDALERNSYEDVIKWAVVLYDAFYSVRYKLS